MFTPDFKHLADRTGVGDCPCFYRTWFYRRRFYGLWFYHFRNMLFVVLCLFNTITSGSDVELDGRTISPARAISGAQTWAPGVADVEQLVIKGQPYNVYVGVHKQVPDKYGWSSFETADRFNANVIAALEMIEQTASGRELLSKYKPPSRFHLHIFEFASEPAYGGKIYCDEECLGYSVSTNQADQYRTRSRLSVDSLKGEGASANVALRKDDVFGFDPDNRAGVETNRAQLLRTLTEELVHSNRAAHGIAPPKLRGLKGLNVTPKGSVGALGLTFRQLIEELEVAGDLLSAQAVNDAGIKAVTSYRPILDELVALNPELDFNLTEQGVGGYKKIPVEDWLRGTEFYKPYSPRLHSSLRNNSKDSVLRALDQIEEWAANVLRLNQGGANSANLREVIEELLTKAHRAKFRARLLCS